MQKRFWFLLYFGEMKKHFKKQNKAINVCVFESLIVPQQRMVPDTEKAINRYAIDTLTVRNPHELMFFKY